MYINNSANRLKNLIGKSGRIALDERRRTLSFSETLASIMKEKKISRNVLALEMGLSERTISKLRNDDDYQTDKQIVIGLCVSLSLTPAEAFSLFDRSPHRLKMTSAQDVAYFHILSTCGQYSLDEVNEMLEEAGFTVIGGFCKRYQE